MSAPPPMPHGPGNADDDLRGSIIACAVVCLCISTAAVAARFYTRSAIAHSVAAEDWFALAALLLSVGSTAGTIWQAQAGKGRHTWTLGPENFEAHGKASWMTTLFYQLSLACCKVSILLLYIRVLTYSYARRAAYILLAIVIIYNTTGFISTFTLCIPLAKVWNQQLEGSCHVGIEYMWALIGLHIGTDFLIFLIPMPVVLRMTTPLGTKIMLLLIFAMGFFVCLISVLRAVWIHSIFTSEDFFWDNVSITNWTTIEVCTSIVCACLIVIKPLVLKGWRAIRPARWASSQGNNPTSSSDASSYEGRPPTIGTRPTAYSHFGDVPTPGNQSGGSREKESSGAEEAVALDEYAAAVREVAMPSLRHPKSKESMSYC